MLKFILTVVVRILASFLINSLFIHHYSQISFQFFFIYIAGNYVPSIAPRTPLSQPGNYVPSNPVTCHKQPGHMSQATRSHVTNQPGHMSQATRSHVTSNPVTCHKPTRSHVTSNPVTCHKQPGHMSQTTRSHVTNQSGHMSQTNPVTCHKQPGHIRELHRCQSLSIARHTAIHRTPTFIHPFSHFNQHANSFFPFFSFLQHNK